VRHGLAILVAVASILFGYGMGRASDKDEAAVRVKVTSADHEMLEGYFSLGDNLVLMAKPGSDFYRFLARQRDRTITVTLSESPTRQLSRLDR
jgi:hypothetical protein